MNRLRFHSNILLIIISTESHLDSEVSHTILNEYIHFLFSSLTNLKNQYWLLIINKYSLFTITHFYHDKGTAAVLYKRHWIVWINVVYMQCLASLQLLVLFIDSISIINRFIVLRCTLITAYRKRKVACNYNVQVRMKSHLRECIVSVRFHHSTLKQSIRIRLLEIIAFGRNLNSNIFHWN